MTADPDEHEDDEPDNVVAWADDLLDRLFVLKTRAEERAADGDDVEATVSQALRLALADEVGTVVDFLEGAAAAQAEAVEALQAVEARGRTRTRSPRAPGGPFSLVDD